MDYQDENVSLLYYNNQSYIGNSYFYQLLQDHISSYEQYTLYNNNNGVEAILAQIFPYNGLGDGTLACQVTFPEGLAYTTYDLYNPDFVAGDNGVVVQTGKYVGNFPMQITASHISADGTLLISSTSIPLEQTYQGDTLIQKIWYGPHLRQKESQIASTADRLWLIENSIEQRILTGSTAFLALEPGAGGEPCIDCLNNNGGLIIQVAETDTSSMHTQWTATPNPAVARASLVFTYHGHYIQDEWQVEIMDMSGKVISVLSAPQVSSGKLIWNWEIGSEVADGMYVAKLTQPAGIWNTKILVQKY